jgi:hypothetical protein
VHEPQRDPWLVTHRTLFGLGTPPRYCLDSSAARRPSSASPRAARRALRRSCVARRSSMIAIQRCSSARDIRAGSSTIVRSPSRYADTVRRRRALRRTSTFVAARRAAASWEERKAGISEAATRAPYLRNVTSTTTTAQAVGGRWRGLWETSSEADPPDFCRVHKANSRLRRSGGLRRARSCHRAQRRPRAVHTDTPPGPHSAHKAVHRPRR